MKNIIMLMGKSGCGKSTLERELIQNYPKLFKKVTSITTRSIRPGEQDGVDYYFLTNEQFDELQQQGKIIQKTQFAGNRYGSTVDEYNTMHQFVTLVVVPSSASSFSKVLKQQFKDSVNIINVYFDISEQQLRQNMKNRGDSDSQINQRLSKDDLDKQLKDNNIIPDYIIKDSELNEFTSQHFFKWLIKNYG